MAENKKDITFGKIGNALKSVAADHVTAFAEDVFDETRQEYQSEINQTLQNEIEEEANRAKAAEEANATAITDEIARAKAAEEANTTALGYVNKKLSDVDKEINGVILNNDVLFDAKSVKYIPINIPSNTKISLTVKTDNHVWDRLIIGENDAGIGSETRIVDTTVFRNEIQVDYTTVNDITRLAIYPVSFVAAGTISVALVANENSIRKNIEDIKNSTSENTNDIEHLTNNAVKLGAIEPAIDKSECVLFSNGSIVYSDSAKRSGIIKVSAGMVLKHNLRVSSVGWAAIACYNANKEYMQEASISSITEGDFVVPENVEYVILCCDNAYPYKYAKFNLTADNINFSINKQHLSKDVETVVNRVITFDVIGAVLADGTISNNSSFTRTSYIRVVEGESLKYELGARSSGWCTIAAYNSNFEFIQAKSVLGNSAVQDGSYFVDKGVSYIILSEFSNHEPKAFLYVDNASEVEGSYRMTLGGILADGRWVTNDVHMVSDFIPVKEGDIIHYEDAQVGSDDWAVLAMYSDKSEHSYIPEKSLIGRGVKATDNIMMEKGISFVRFCSAGANAKVIKNRIIRENTDTKNVPAYISYLKYNNIVDNRGCIAMQMDYMFTDSYRQMLSTVREYGLPTVDIALNIRNLKLPELDWFVSKQTEGCEFIYHNLINSPSDVSDTSTLSIEEAKAGICDERLRMAKRGLVAYGMVANNGEIAEQYRPMIDKLFYYRIHNSTNIHVGGEKVENTKESYLDSHRVIRTGFDLLHEDYTKELEELYITKGKEWIDMLCEHKSMGVMYCHSFNTHEDNYTLHESVLRAMCEYIVQKINNGELYYGTTSECLNYICR